MAEEKIEPGDRQSEKSEQMTALPGSTFMTFLSATPFGVLMAHQAFQRASGLDLIRDPFAELGHVISFIKLSLFCDYGLEELKRFLVDCCARF
jgi:hypothetical protein